MAIYHLSVKPISRSKGRSATAAAAYRAGIVIADERTGLVHDYTRRGGVDREHSPGVVLPAGAAAELYDPAKLWNGAELAEKRKDACTAREYQLAFPAELTPAECGELGHQFAEALAARHGVAVDARIHEPDREGDSRNRHGHFLTTTRVVGPDGFGPKADIEKSGRDRKADLEATRALWEDLTNKALERAGHSARIDRRTLAEQRAEKIAQGELVPEREATQHQGPAVTNSERKAKREAHDKGEEYTPVTAVAQENAARQERNESRARQFARWLKSKAEAIAEAAMVAAERLAEVGKVAFGERYATVTAGKAAFVDQWRGFEAERQRQDFARLKAEQEREFQANLRREQAAERERAAKPTKGRDGPGMSR